jgi:hypothetical protein
LLIINREVLHINISDDVIKVVKQLDYIEKVSVVDDDLGNSYSKSLV